MAQVWAKLVVVGAAVRLPPYTAILSSTTVHITRALCPIPLPLPSPTPPHFFSTTRTTTSQSTKHLFPLFVIPFFIVLVLAGRIGVSASV